MKSQQHSLGTENGTLLFIKGAYRDNLFEIGRGATTGKSFCVTAVKTSSSIVTATIQNINIYQIEMIHLHLSVSSSSSEQLLAYF